MNQALSSLQIGSLVAIGFDASGRYLLVVSHDGRGVFDMRTWARVARDAAVAYPEEGIAIGIGPIAGERIVVQENDFSRPVYRFTSPDGSFHFAYQSGVVTITASAADDSAAC